MSREINNATYSSAFLKNSQGISTPKKLFEDFIKEKEGLEYSSNQRLMTKQVAHRPNKSKFQVHNSMIVKTMRFQSKLQRKIQNERDISSRGGSSAAKFHELASENMNNRAFSKMDIQNKRLTAYNTNQNMSSIKNSRSTPKAVNPVRATREALNYLKFGDKRKNSSNERETQMLAQNSKRAQKISKMNDLENNKRFNTRQK